MIFPLFSTFSVIGDEILMDGTVVATISQQINASARALFIESLTEKEIVSADERTKRFISDIEDGLSSAEDAIDDAKSALDHLKKEIKK